jgi:hypothetical protein
MARNAVTVVKAEERASTMPKLHKANTVAWGLLNAGRWVLGAASAPKLQRNVAALEARVCACYRCALEVYLVIPETLA